MRRALFLPLPLMLAACGPGGDPGATAPANGSATAPIEEASPSAEPVAADEERPAPAPAPVPSASATPATESDDADPDEAADAETPEAEQGAPGAVRVVTRYYALIGAGLYRQAYALWAPGRAGMTAAQFARSFDRYGEYRAEIGTPGAIEGAAGSRYVTVPVRPYGTLKDGKRPFNMRGTLTLRRTANVPGATTDQQRWHIYDSSIKPRPGEPTPTPKPQPTEDNRSVARNRCDDGTRLTARFDPDNGRVALVRGGERLATLQQRRAASGIWYATRDWEFRGKGRAMTLTQDGKPPLSCTAIVP